MQRQEVNVILQSNKSGTTVQDEYADTLCLRQDVNAVVLIHHEHRKSDILIPENYAFMNRQAPFFLI
ncbi:hypothetical protein T11_13252 [Trichinella zimbabwensis]|uniref:Uncharacterized protein n=1 Tax=Trichinella zimbabwensis TaxID=268475 RepID=A0A0V1GSQ7_9BILA|nr:hypothetical protein T11_13252 [Trichinella zimbabwensis]